MGPAGGLLAGGDRVTGSVAKIQCLVQVMPNLLPELTSDTVCVIVSNSVDPCAVDQKYNHGRKSCSSHICRPFYGLMFS